MSNIFKSKRALHIYGISVLSVALLCTTLRLIGTIFFFDADIGYYQTGRLIPIVANILPALAAIAAIALCMISRINVHPAPVSETNYTQIGSAFSAVGFAAFTVIYVINLFEYSSVYGNIPFSYLLCALCSVGACAFFTLKTFKRSNPSVLCALTGLLTVVWFVLQLAECYFDTFVQMNSPIKLVFQFACLGAMLLAVNEMRVGLDSKRTGFHLLSATLASIFLPMSAVPSVICYLTDNMPSNYVLFYSDCVMLLLSVFAVTRLVQMCFGKEATIACEVCDETTESVDIPSEVFDTEDNTEEE